MNTFLLVYGTALVVAFILIAIDADRAKKNPNQKWTRLESKYSITGIHKSKINRMLTIHETADTILQWIKSCNSEKQLSLCNELIEKFIVERFKHYSSPAEMAAICSRLDTAINKRKDKVLGIGLIVVN
jgi:hypothetical protein